MKKKNRLQMLAVLLAATLSVALTSPIAAKANEEYNVGTTKEANAETGRIYYLKNSHGDIIGQMDENGNVLTSYAYNAFGEQVSAVVDQGEQKCTTNRFLYAGEQYDETSGLYYLRARHYDVRAGRFIQEDTYLGDGRNLYAYVHSNPLKYVDPTGHNAQATPDDNTNLLNEEKVYEGGKVSESATGSIVYGKLDSLGRATGIEATITSDMIGTGSPAKSSIKPAGFEGQAQGHARGHLLGNQLGGSGSDPENLVTIYQNPVNHPVMSSLEGSVRNAVEGGQSVTYKVTPIYQGSDLIPSGITIQAQGSGGLNIYQTVLNRK